MDQAQLEDFKSWFEHYVAGFYGEDEYANANMELKHEHTHRTCQEMLYLAEELGLEASQRRIAYAVALFHDIGRFEQFATYRTYNDPRSINHCLLGVEVLRKTNVLDKLDGSTRQLIETAVRYHGERQLPADLNGDCLFLSQLIRDADKLDGLYILTEYYNRYRADPERFKLELEFPDEPWYSVEVVEAILQEKLVDYSSLRTINDMRLCQLGWVYDVNFAATLRRIKQRGFLESLLSTLPQTRDIERVRDKIFAYVDFRIEQ